MSHFTVTDILAAHSDCAALIEARYSRKLRFLSSRYDTDDLIQETGSRCLMHADSCHARTESELKHWIMTIAANTYRSAVTHHMGLAKRSLRSEGCVIGVSLEGQGRHRGESEGYQPAGRFVDPSVAVETSEQTAMLLAAVNRLNELQARVVKLKFIEQLDNATIAAELGCTVQAVKSVSSRALATLRNAMAAVAA